MLALLSTRLGQGVAIVVVGIVACGASYLYGRHEQAQLDNVAAIKAELAATTADLNITKALAAVAEDEKRAIERVAAANQDQIDDYEKALAERPDDRCKLNADDVRRLRALAPSP